MNRMKKFAFALCCISIYFLFTQYSGRTSADRWVDSVFHSLSKEEKIAQLMVIRAHSNLGADHVKQVTSLIEKYNVGALCFFQGGPVKQAALTNYYQSIAQTPLMVTIDGEWGLGMRLDSVIKYPYQLTLGALKDDKLVYEMGVAVGEQMKRIGVHVNYAPVVDINNNPANPVIGYRSFGEDKYKVAQLGVAYAKGMQSVGIMACAKHFPGHGDVAVDSHYDLPVINKTKEQLDTLELYPFKQLFKAGVGSVMIAHLSIPVIDNSPNRPTSLSAGNVTRLLRDELYYEGLTFTDALEMKGVTKYFGAGEAAVEALIAGNDMLCLPENVPVAIAAIKKAIKKKRLSWDNIDKKVRRVLYSKYQLGLHQPQVIDTTNLLADLNAKTASIRQRVAANAVTLMTNGGGLLPLAAESRIAYVGIGTTSLNAFGQRLKEERKADTFLLSYADSTAKASAVLDAVKAGNYDRVIIGLHNYSVRPAGNYGISQSAVQLINNLQAYKAVTFLFGNVYAAQNFCKASTLVAMYEDDEPFHQAAADFLQGRIAAKGTLPVTVCHITYGTGIAFNHFAPVGITPEWKPVDEIVQEGLARNAYPGAVVLAVQNGVIKYHKAFGRYEFDSSSQPVSLESIYDLASVTKVSATTVAVMKLYEEGKLDLHKTLGDYLPITVGTDKAPLLIKDVLLHRAGLNPFISFYKETIDSTGQPSPAMYQPAMDSLFTIPVAKNVWLRRDWNDSMMKRIVESKLGQHGKYVYSDNDFILLGKIVESISGMPLDQYVQKTFYGPMGMASTGFKPWQRFVQAGIVPTENEKYFRRQMLRGYVHDEGAAMFGGVSGHAGLFSNAYDLSLLYQMLLNGGTFNGERYLKPQTVQFFTAYGAEESRRGLGFDKPEKDNATRKEPYPSALASSDTYGHTGFTGTCVWVDPKANMVYIFLSNRVYNTRANNLLGELKIRGRVQDAIYKALEDEQKGNMVKGF